MAPASGALLLFDASWKAEMSATAARKHPPTALTLWPLVLVFFFDVSGGPYGLEEAMQSGPGMAILLILLTPVLWAMPAALMTAELASAIPAEGGYYVWAKRAVGPFWSFVCAWWTWVYSWVDIAIYPVLFAAYVKSLLTLLGSVGALDTTHPWIAAILADSHPWIKWALGMVVIVPFTWLNIRGTKLVGRTAIYFGALLIAPFVLMVLLGLPKLFENPGAVVRPFVPPGQSIGSAFNAGLFVVMWNYLGWDSLSTIAEEVENPRKTYPKALSIAVPLVTLVYLLPSLVGLAVHPDFASWEEGTWTTVALKLGGPLLGGFVTAMGMVSAAGLFMATLLGASRIPFVLAEDRYLPQGVTRLHPKYGTPWVAILISALFYTVLSFKEFEDLAVLDVIVYSCAILIEFAALVILRVREPDLERPYRIPGGLPGVILVAILPAAIVAFATYNQITEEGVRALWLSMIALATGPIAYFVGKAVQRLR